MTDNVIEIRPGVRQTDLTREPYGPEIQPLNLADPMMQADVMRECRQYALAVHSACYIATNDVDLVKAIRVCKSLATILEAVATARLAGRAAMIARDVDEACRAAMEAAETL